MHIIAYDQFDLANGPEQIQDFITDPAKVRQYYPMVIDSWTTGHQQLICTGFMGSALIEQISCTSFASRRQTFANKLPVISDQAICLETKVYGLFYAKPANDVNALKQRAFFTMHEDWIIEANGSGGSKLCKVWRDLEQKKYRALPLERIIHRTAKSEHRHLAAAWGD